MQKREIEEILGCGNCAELSPEYRKVAYSIAVDFVKQFSIPDSGYILDLDLVKRRIENLMYQDLLKDPFIIPSEFRSFFRLSEIFMDVKAIDFLITLAGEEEEFAFEYIKHFFAPFIISYMRHHQFMISSLDQREVISILYTETYFAVRKCAQKRMEEAALAMLEEREAKKIFFSFKTLSLMYRAAVNELYGVVILPFTLHRKDTEQYYRFRATISNTNHHYGTGDVAELSNRLSIAENTLRQYWELYNMEVSGFISTSSMAEDERTENMYGATYETGYERMDINSIRDHKFRSEADRRIFDHLVENASSTFCRNEIEEIGTTRYRIGQVLNDLRVEFKDEVQVSRLIPIK